MISLISINALSRREAETHYSRLAPSYIGAQSDSDVLSNTDLKIFELGVANTDRFTGPIALGVRVISVSYVESVRLNQSIGG